MFNSYPQQLCSEESKVFFAISHMKRMAVEWLEHGVMESNPTITPTWHCNWNDFIIKLHTNFGPANPTGTVEAKLHHLFMNHDTHLMEYLVCFNTLATCINWGDGALHFQFYDGLPNCLKDKITILGKPDNLQELVQTTQCYDNLHWERMEECKFG